MTKTIEQLKNVVSLRLEEQGVLAKMKAQLRQAVFLALEEDEKKELGGCTEKKSAEPNKLQQMKSSKHDRSALSLIKQFLQHYELTYTLSVFEAEAGLDDGGVEDGGDDGTLAFGKGAPALVGLLQNYDDIKESASNPAAHTSDTIPARATTPAGQRGGLPLLGTEQNRLSTPQLVTRVDLSGLDDLPFGGRPPSSSAPREPPAASPTGEEDRYFERGAEDVRGSYDSRYDDGDGVGDGDGYDDEEDVDDAYDRAYDGQDYDNCDRDPRYDANDRPPHDYDTNDRDRPRDTRESYDSRYDEEEYGRDAGYDGDVRGSVDSYGGEVRESMASAGNDDDYYDDSQYDDNYNESVNTELETETETVRSPTSFSTMAPSTKPLSSLSVSSTDTAGSPTNGAASPSSGTTSPTSSRPDLLRQVSPRSSAPLGKPKSPLGALAPLGLGTANPLDKPKSPLSKSPLGALPKMAGLGALPPVGGQSSLPALGGGGGGALGSGGDPEPEPEPEAEVEPVGESEEEKAADLERLAEIEAKLKHLEEQKTEKPEPEQEEEYGDEYEYSDDGASIELNESLSMDDDDIEISGPESDNDF